MSVSLDLTISPQDMIYKLLTESTTKLPTGTSLTASDLTLSAVTEVTGRSDGNNTSITLTPVSSSTVVYGDPKVVYYTRRDFGTAVNNAALSLAITDELSNWTSDTAAGSALSLLKSGLTSFLTADDLVVGSPVTNQDGSVSTTVTLADAFLTMVGSVTFVVTAEDTRTNTSDIPEDQDGLS